MESVGKTDTKGRIVLPARVRAALKIEPGDRVVVEVKKVLKSRRFVDKWRGTLKGLGDPVELKHAAFRSRRH
mgnify:FL=1